MKFNSLLNVLLLRSIFFFLISYGMLYFSYKYYTPNFGGTDFFAYYHMILEPLDFDAAVSPFVYRQFSALIASFFLKSGIYYNIPVSYSEIGIDQKVFFASILSNYVALFFTALVVSRVADLEIGKTSVFAPLLAGMFCFMSFGTSTFVLTGLVEGWTWFLIALGFYAFKKENVYLFGAVIIIAIFQKEVISITFGAMSAVFLLIDFIKKHGMINKKYLSIFLMSLTSFIFYIVMRKVLLPVEGYEYQLEPSSLSKKLVEFNVFDFELMKPTLFSQNLLCIYILLFFITLGIYKHKNISNLYHGLRIGYGLSIMFAWLVLYVVGMAVGIFANIGRVTHVLSPVFSIYIAYYLFLLENIYEQG